MIITNAIGGLGNQMFQYAAGRALSLRTNQAFAINTSNFNHYKLHNGYELHRLFDLSAPIATKSDISQVIGLFAATAIEWSMPSRIIQAFARSNFLKEQSFSYVKKFSELRGSYYLDGYWQSEQYFKEYAAHIRADFRFRDEFTLVNSKIYEEIKDSCSVSCHIRRGDYVSNYKTSQIHGSCTKDYYSNAIKHIKEKLVNPRFFIFSDDQEWVRGNLVFPKNSFFVSGNRGSNSFRDMQLMSVCQHHIIANSSFSWWGAWLNPNQSKIVVAPRRWFAADIDDSDLIPKEWIRL